MRVCLLLDTVEGNRLLSVISGDDYLKWLLKAAKAMVQILVWIIGLMLNH